MKSLFLIIATLFFIGNLHSQDVKKNNSKMDIFVSKKGVMLKFEDYNLPSLETSYGKAKTKIRKLTSGIETKFFYQISKKGEYGTNTASIAYEDLAELQKAIIVLKNEALVDNSTSSDYTENKFVTEDGFQVGYYVSKGKLKWYMVLGSYGNDNTIFIKNAALISQAFDHAKEKIDDLK